MHLKKKKLKTRETKNKQCKETVSQCHNNKDIFDTVYLDFFLLLLFSSYKIWLI